MTAIEFLRRYRGSDLVPSAARGEFELKSHDSFKINGESSLWHWKSRDIGGKSALDYLIKVEGVPFMDAVRQLSEDTPGFVAVPHVQVQSRRKPFELPPAAQTTERVEKYLLERGISREVITACIRQGILYESYPYHNCVFVGRDETGKARYAALRGTYLYGKPFKMEQAGSEKRYGFCITPYIINPMSDPACTRVALFESAIDAMAEMTLCVDDTLKYRLSVGGIYAPEPESETRARVRESKPPQALVEFLQRHPEIDEIEMCFDNDYAGRYAARQIQRTYQDIYRVIDNPPKIKDGDYADLAQKTMQAARKRAACVR